jgi:hypothetical protein
MRVLLLALMIALLPLRGWVGDAMAMDMMTEALHAPLHAIKSVASDDHTTGHGSHLEAHHADCAEHAAPAPTSDAAGSHDGNCASHAACQLCHSVALAPPPLTLAPAALPLAAPPLALAGFVSAELPRGFKPPIA